MNCEKAKEILPLYIDEIENDLNTAELKKHLVECKNCKNEYILYKKIYKNCNEAYKEINMPNNYHKNLIQRLKTQESDFRNIRKFHALASKTQFPNIEQNINNKNFNYKYLTLVSSFILLLFIISSFLIIPNKNRTNVKENDIAINHDSNNQQLSKNESLAKADQAYESDTKEMYGKSPIKEDEEISESSMNNTDKDIFSDSNKFILIIGICITLLILILIMKKVK